MKKEYFTTFLNSPVGYLRLTSTKTALVTVNFSDEFGEDSVKLPEILLQTKQQLIEYFEGKRFSFQLNLAPEGTAFQQKVWKQVEKVPFGQTATYLEIARQIGSTKYTRAVGLANGKNPIPIIIPCHRIIGSNGKLTGYAGGLKRKRWLLQHELTYSSNPERLF